MILDFTTTAVNRPDIVDRTYSSFYKNLKNVDFDQCTLYINIDPLPKSEGREEVVEVSKKYFGNVVSRMPEKGNYTEAYNWLWSSAQTEYLFNLEDDWILIKEVNIEKLINIFHEQEGLYEVALRAYPYKYDKCPTSPNIMHRRYYSKVGGNLDPNINPEVQLRGKNFGLEMPSKDSGISAKGKIIAWPKNRIIVKDIGREWIENSKLRRPNKKSHFTTWVEK